MKCNMQIMPCTPIMRFESMTSGEVVNYCDAFLYASSHMRVKLDML